MPVRVECEICGKVMTRPPSLIQAHVFCGYVCAAKGRRKDPSTRRMVKRPDHPLAPPGGLLAWSRIVLYEKIGPGPHPCHWCGSTVNWMPGSGPRSGAIVADHVDSDHTNDVPENLVPACQPCNGTREIRVGDDEIFIVKDGYRVRAARRMCKTCGETFLIPRANLKKPGAGTYCSPACLHGRRQVPA